MRRTLHATLAVMLVLFALPLAVFAQRSDPPAIPGGPYVPVVDVWVNLALSEFLLTNPDSLRNVLGGSRGTAEAPEPVGAKYFPDVNVADPGAVQPAEICKLTNPKDIPRSWVIDEGINEETENTPWYRASLEYAMDATGVPAIDQVLEFPNIQINDSTSVSCLLQELVEWQKVQLFLSIHNMIREYI